MPATETQTKTRKTKAKPKAATRRGKPKPKAGEVVMSQADLDKLLKEERDQAKVQARETVEQELKAAEFADDEFEEEEEVTNPLFASNETPLVDVEDIFSKIDSSYASKGVAVFYQVKRNGQFIGDFWHPDLSWQMLLNEYGGGQYLVQAKMADNKRIITQQTQMLATPAKANNSAQDDEKPEQETPKQSQQPPPAFDPNVLVEMYSRMQDTMRRDNKTEEREDRRIQSDGMNLVVQMITQTQASSQTMFSQMQENTTRMIEKMSENTNRLMEKQDDKMDKMFHRMTEAAKPKDDFGTMQLITMLKDSEKTGFENAKMILDLAESKADVLAEEREANREDKSKSLTDTLLQAVVPLVAQAGKQIQTNPQGANPQGVNPQWPNPQAGTHPMQHLDPRTGMPRRAIRPGAAQPTNPTGGQPTSGQPTSGQPISGLPIRPQTPRGPIAGAGPRFAPQTPPAPGVSGHQPIAGQTPYVTTPGGQVAPQPPKVMPTSGTPHVGLLPSIPNATAHDPLGLRRQADRVPETSGASMRGMNQGPNVPPVPKPQPSPIIGRPLSSPPVEQTLEQLFDGKSESCIKIATLAIPKIGDYINDVNVPVSDAALLTMDWLNQNGNSRELVLSEFTFDFMLQIAKHFNIGTEKRAWFEEFYANFKNSAGVADGSEEPTLG